MQCAFPSVPPMQRPIPLVLLGQWSLNGTAFHGQPATVRLCFEPLKVGHDGPAPSRLAVVSSLWIGGLAPEQLRGIQVRDECGDVLCLGSFDSQAGRAVTAGDMLLAMARMAGTDGLWLDLHGAVVRWEHLAVELLADLRGPAAAEIEVLAVLQPVGRSAPATPQAVWPEVARRVV